MDKIYFATGNEGKYLSLKKYFATHGVDIDVERASVEMTEPQAETATEVALSKARQAFAALNQPVVVDDSSFHISALGGFPGPYIKYMLSTIGIVGILDFLARHDDRSAYFLSTLVYIDQTGQEHVFEDEPYKGTISKNIVEVDRKESWSDLYKVFIPDGTHKALVELTDEERRSLNTQGDSYDAFTQWIKSELSH
ncbi:MAG: non-canonical purine NTP pyrophosphatase [Candidatus Saccharibacteria bacterium]